MVKACKIVIFILAGFITLSYEDNNEESRPGIEYAQIFRNIPTLFEYFLDVFYKRVEILEMDDITFFQKDYDKEKSENNEVKRELDQCSVITENSANDDLIKDDPKHYHSGNQYKRQNVIDKAYAIKPNENLNAGTKHETIKREFIDKPYTEQLSALKNRNIRSAKNIQIEMDTSKRIDKVLEKDFAGIDWSLLYLSPEEVEEKAIITEQMIEEHNKKNRKK